MHRARGWTHDKGQQPRHERCQAAVCDRRVSSSGHGPMVVGKQSECSG
ncbi:hypothetical protein LI99_11200 [Mycolicibacterium smegmatis]|uniref:Uncharacterized protein n=1 Tax=Mycolicibacterium smegmatis (strain ATCC 700084 / mc(2)155) TaxID=246196 RepID=A0QUL4_MYCS2|nr:hypothetical protein MSMEG_2250 [Mycolicibacterium smegmatis MC2 155]AIU14070.1 hypothetical protein LI99_11200 [Mycolicibacterium smegmatis]AIU07445.1 hypothetical protein LJ00_11200 [Mycolicibacterium smegmatis MC2 155]AIU20693.1 hypothetical protein LI98_11205 [Mycolicibacterium smegmatis]TBH33903.1 hypothetical protein EYS45_20205 [Mycolicibacterium smegmatis MC2 155]